MNLLRSMAIRLIRALILLFGISIFTFGLTSLAPGDPAEMILESDQESVAPEKTAILRRELGLDRSFLQRYGDWAIKAMRLDFGLSYRTGEPVGPLLLSRLPATLELAAAAFCFIVVLSAATGLAAAFWRGRWPDRLDRAWVVLHSSLPNYWLALLLILFFALKLKLLPVMGREGKGALILPVLTLGLSLAAIQGRAFHASLLQVLSQDYIRFALAKGLSPWAVLRRHALRNALPPLVTMWGLSLGNLLGGSVLVESIFAWPGLGRLTAEAILVRDVPLIQGSALLMTLLYSTVNQLAEAFHRLLEPKIARMGNDSPLTPGF
ncbi:MAG: ABC transporter permease [Thermodesulfobacteriota bacterium]